MSVELTELSRSRPWDTSATSAGGQWLYLARVQGEANPEQAVIDAVTATAPYYWYNLSQTKISAEAHSPELFTVTVEYGWEDSDSVAQDPTVTPDPSTGGPGGGPPSGTPSGPASDDVKITRTTTIEIGGKPPKLLLSLDVVFSEKAGGGGAAPDHGGLLNIRDGKPEGQEVEDPGSVMTIDIEFDSVSWGYIRFLQSAVWSVNDAVFRRQDPGCVAFMGASLSTNDRGRIAANFRFGLRPEITVEAESLRADVGHELPTNDQTLQGWEYMEVDYERVEPAVSGFPITVLRPSGVRFHKMLPALDFALFGIGE